MFNLTMVPTHVKAICHVACTNAAFILRGLDFQHVGPTMEFHLSYVSTGWEPQRIWCPREGRKFPSLSLSISNKEVYLENHESRSSQSLTRRIVESWVLSIFDLENSWVGVEPRVGPSYWNLEPLKMNAFTVLWVLHIVKYKKPKSIQDCCIVAIN